MSKSPTVARVTHVEGIIVREAAFAALLGPKSTSMTRRDGQELLFYAPSVAIAQMIHDDGVDAITLSKAAILEYASRYFAAHGGSKVPPSVTATASEPSKAVAPAEGGGTPEDLISRNIGLAIYTLLGAANQLAVSDKRPGCKERANILSQAFSAYRPQTTVS